EDPLGRIDRAVRWFHRAWRCQPSNPLYRAAWGEALVHAGKYRQGCRLLYQAARLAPAQTSVLRYVVHGLIGAGRPALALRLLGPARFLWRTTTAQRRLQDWIRQLRYEQACRRRPQSTAKPTWATLPLRAG
ncbi:MAG: hypothetical protein NZ703_01195, partial [Gemmataceae bacterium]|nr:hypothetical protein [Gemmataceae bacterium]